MNTYATIVLWNYAMKRPSSDPTNPSNLHSIHTMTGTRTEEWFYLISVALEASGGPIILELLDCMENVNRGDSIATAASLKRTANSVIRIGMLLERMYESCEVQTFYHDVRPLLSGTKGHAALGLPQGVFYDEGSGKGSWRQYAGGSNAQSSLIQFLDVALGVTHHTTGEGNSVQNGKHGRPREGGFVEVRFNRRKPAYDIFADRRIGNAPIHAPSTSRLSVRHGEAVDHPAVCLYYGG